jgi:hypothetical protein
MGIAIGLGHQSRVARIDGDEVCPDHVSGQKTNSKTDFSEGIDENLD